MLPPSDLCTALQVCKALAAAGDSDLVWRAVACSRWPAESVVLGDKYKSYRELTLDDNRHNTAWYYPLERGTSCTWMNSQDDGYYKCHLIGMQRPRDGSKELRLYYDARGEDDLRLPRTSMVRLEMHMGPDAGDRTVGLGAIDADKAEEYVSKPGHFKGCLVWDARHTEAIEAAMAIEENDTGAAVVRRSLVFQYGCRPLALMQVNPGEPGGLHEMLDYTGAKLFELHQGDDFEQLWRNQAVVTAKGATARQLAAEGEEEQRQRWADLPQGVKRRGNAWPGADGLGEWPEEQA